MQTKQQPELNRIVAFYNMLPNVFWSVVSLLPIYIFCYRHLTPQLLYIFIGVSLLPIFLPRACLRWLQIGKTAAIYKKLGVPFINKFTQKGTIINTFIRKKYPQYKIVASKERAVKKLISQTYLFEKFHVALFLFFSFCTIYALVNKYIYWSVILLIINIIYNIYPCLLQQYIRVRLTYSGRKNSN